MTTQRPIVRNQNLTVLVPVFKKKLSSFKIGTKIINMRNGYIYIKIKLTFHNETNSQRHSFMKKHLDIEYKNTEMTESSISECIT